MYQNHIKINLENEGYQIVRKNIFNINNDLKEFLSIFEKKDIPVHGSFNNIRVLKNLDNFEFLEKIYKQLETILKLNNLDDYQLEDVWAQKSKHNNSRPGELPFIPHIDKVRKFKVMVYLNDVSKNSGPIHFVKCRTNDYENFRQNLGVNYQVKKQNVIKDFSISQYESCSGHQEPLFFLIQTVLILLEKLNKKILIRDISTDSIFQ